MKLKISYWRQLTAKSYLLLSRDLKLLLLELCELKLLLCAVEFLEALLSDVLLCEILIGLLLEVLLLSKLLFLEDLILELIKSLLPSPVFRRAIQPLNLPLHHASIGFPPVWSYRDY